VRKLLFILRKTVLISLVSLTAGFTSKGGAQNGAFQNIFTFIKNVISITFLFAEMVYFCNQDHKSQAHRLPVLLRIVIEQKSLQKLLYTGQREVEFGFHKQIKQQPMISHLSSLLINEHRIILRACNCIPANYGLWKVNPDEYEKFIVEMLNFFSVYADEFHHKKEEEILFPALAEKSETVGSELVRELLEQHENFRETARNIRNLIEAGDYEAAHNQLKEYAEALYDHIGIEDDEIFPMADGLFNDDELAKLHHRCIDKDAELGSDKKVELEKFASTIKTELYE
jgi:hemerythrin-like domain-containing protein